MCGQVHVHTPVNTDPSPVKASQFICHMPRVVWGRSTIIHSSGLQHEWLPFPLIYSPIYTSDTALLHLKTLVDIKREENKTGTIINLAVLHRPGRGQYASVVKS